MENTKLSLQETLLPALVQCFGIIFIGYILGKAKILGQAQAQGLSTFVQYLSLPALIFVTVSTIPFTQIKWEFIASIFVAKTCVFIFVAIISMLVTHPHDLGKSGIFAIAATQSNDFALGYPLLIALYQNTHPEFPTYLYIIAPIQLLILNTIGFFLLEVEKHTHSRIKKGNYFCHILKGTLQNPVVIMTIAGLIWNVWYGEKTLPILDNILKAFSSAFPATALLLVGYTMTVTNTKSCSRISLPVILLIVSKNLILPLILQKLSGVMLRNSSQDEIQSFSSFGFLYGTIPTAPTVYVFATQYNTAIDIITKTIIGSTVISAPLMFASASVISLAQVGIENASFYLSLTISYLSCINVGGCIWLLLIFLMGKRWRSISFGITFYLVLAQFVMAIGGILLFIPTDDYSTLFCIQYVLTTGSIFVTRICTFLLAGLLLIIRIRSLCYILQVKKLINYVTLIFGFILPYVLAACCLITKSKDTSAPNFQLGFIQIVMTFVVTLLCLVGTVICVFMQQIYLKRNSNKLNRELLNASVAENPCDRNCTSSLPVMCSSYQASTSARNFNDIEDIARTFSLGNCTECDDSRLINDSDRVCDSRFQCSVARRIQCSTEVSRYINENNQIGTGLIDDEYFCKHIVLLIILGVAMTLSLFVCIWKLMMEAINGIFIELEFLDVIVNYSLGVVYFITFGLDTKLIQLICAKFKFVKSKTQMDNNYADVCHQFLSHHYERCREDIGQHRIINNVEYFDIFAASALANWLLEKGVCDTNEEAELCIECLLKAHIIDELDERDGSLQDIHLFTFSSPNFSINI